MFNNMIKYKFLLSLIFVSFLINKEALAIVTKSTGDVKYKNYLSNYSLRRFRTWTFKNGIYES